MWIRLEPSLMQILVVVANTQVRSLRTNVEKGSMWTAVEHGSAGPEECGEIRSQSPWFIYNSNTVLRCIPKGNWVNIPKPGHGKFSQQWVWCGNAIDLWDVGESPGKSCLFFVRYWVHGIGLTGDMDDSLEKHCGSCSVRSTFVGPWKPEWEILFSYQSVPISAAGLQG
jgi:hypothetical protein